MSETETKNETEASAADAATPEKDAPTKQAPQAGKNKPGHLPPYHVILMDDMDHTHEYVIEMMRALFGYPPERGYRIAEEVNSQKKVIVFTTHKEHAELKRDQIHAFGTDVRVATCAGSMSACIVKAE